jgi:hypothetical protein
VSNEKETDGNGTKRQHLASRSTQMMYNVMEDISKLRINMPFMEVVKIPQQRQNILKLLDNPSKRDEACR